jgi:glutamine cyclotransferase
MLAAATLVIAAPADARGSPPPADATFAVQSRRPHDDRAFTQGLQLDDQGRLFESLGLFGRSSLREVDARTGEVLREVPLPDDRFGEGLALVADRLVQLTWLGGEAFVWDVETFELLETFEYEGQGWGLCYDGARLVMSDGSERLTFRDAESFEVVGSVSVMIGDEAVTDLNELECVDDEVWANVLKSDEIMRIDPNSGAVTAVLDLSGILDAHPDLDSRREVLNGIAYDAAADSYLVTGKNWPELIEIDISA